MLESLHTCFRGYSPDNNNNNNNNNNNKFYFRRYGYVTREQSHISNCLHLFYEGIGELRFRDWQWK